jgi:pimeloyl-ACP methyl ester carboxylesterase
MTSIVQSQVHKSTNVRSINSESVVRGTLRALALVAPEVAAGWAEHMFLSPRRHARPASEKQWAESAERGEVRYRTQLLPTYSWGSGPAVLLVHGWEGRATQLGAFIPALVEAGFRVVAVDFPGHGEAEEALSSVADFADALRTVIQRLGPFHAIVAHSMGAAATALSYTLLPFEARLVLVGAPRGPRRFFDAFMEHLGLNAPIRARVGRRIEQRYGFSFSALDVDDFGGRVALPSLVVHDRGDKEVPFEHGNAIARALPAATLVATDGLGHRRILRDAGVIDLAVRFIAQSELTALAISPAA